MWPQFWSSSSCCFYATRCTVASRPARPRRQHLSAVFAPRPTEPSAQCPVHLPLSLLHPGPILWSNWIVSPGGPATNLRDPSRGPTTVAPLVPGQQDPDTSRDLASDSPNSSPFLKLMGRVRGHWGTTRKSYFSKLGLCPCPCLCLWQLRAWGWGLRKDTSWSSAGVSAEGARIVV